MKKFFVSFAIFFLVTGFSFSQQDQLLKSLQEKFKSINDFAVNFQQINGGRIVATGKFFFKQKKKTRIELGDILLTTDGKTTYSFNNKTKKLIISNYDESDPSMISLDAIINEYPKQCRIEESKEKKMITIVPENSTLNFKQVKLFVTDSYLVSKIEVTNYDDQFLVMNFENYKINNNLSDNLFSISRDDGTKVIDLR